jgi:hypothetical protein
LLFGDVRCHLWFFEQQSFGAFNYTGSARYAGRGYLANRYAVAVKHNFFSAACRHPAAGAIAVGRICHDHRRHNIDSANVAANPANIATVVGVIDIIGGATIVRGISILLADWCAGYYLGSNR